MHSRPNYHKQTLRSTIVAPGSITEPDLAKSWSTPPANEHVGSYDASASEPEKKVSTTVVVPARNEARNLAAVLPELPADYEIVLVDGHSVDDTVAVAKEARPDIRVVQQTGTGKGNALACGFHAASGDVIVMFDADGSADPAEIPAFVAALHDGVDYAKGSRFRRGGGSADITPLRRLGNATLCLLANRLFGTQFSDLCYGYNAFWRQALPVLCLPDVERPRANGEMLWGDGFEIETVLNCRCAAAGLRVAEVPSVERARLYGASHLRTFADGWRVLRTLLTEYLEMARKHRPDRARVNNRRLGPRWRLSENE